MTIDINGRRVDADTTALLQAAAEEMDRDGILSPATADALDDRRTRAYITGDDDLVDFLGEILEKSYQVEQCQGR